MGQLICLPHLRAFSGHLKFISATSERGAGAQPTNRRQHLRVAAALGDSTCNAGVAFANNEAQQWHFAWLLFLLLPLPLLVNDAVDGLKHCFR